MVKLKVSWIRGNILERKRFFASPAKESGFPPIVKLL